LPLRPSQFGLCALPLSEFWTILHARFCSTNVQKNVTGSVAWRSREKVISPLHDVVLELAGGGEFDGSTGKNAGEFFAHMVS
jgi:hypothetical protein